MRLHTPEIELKINIQTSFPLAGAKENSDSENLHWRMAPYKYVLTLPGFVSQSPANETVEY